MLLEIARHRAFWAENRRVRRGAGAVHPGGAEGDAGQRAAAALAQLAFVFENRDKIVEAGGIQVDATVTADHAGDALELRPSCQATGDVVGSMTWPRSGLLVVAKTGGIPSF